MKNFRIIKSKDFNTDNVKGTSYTVAYKGRVLNVSSLAFEAEDLTVSTDKTILSISCDIELVKSPYTNSVGETVQGVKIMPSLGLALSDF